MHSIMDSQRVKMDDPAQTAFYALSTTIDTQKRRIAVIKDMYRLWTRGNKEDLQNMLSHLSNGPLRWKIPWFMSAAILSDIPSVCTEKTQVEKLLLGIRAQVDIFEYTCDYESIAFSADNTILFLSGHIKSSSSATDKSYETDFVHRWTFDAKHDIVQFEEFIDTHAFVQVC